MSRLNQYLHPLSEHESFHHPKDPKDFTIKQLLEPPSPSPLTSFKNTSSSPSFIPSSSESPNDLSADISLLKQAIASVISEFNEKHKEKYKKEAKLKQLEVLCLKNKKKIKNMKNSIKDHEEKIIMLERKLNAASPSLISDPPPEKVSPRHLFYDKAFVPKFSTTGNSNINLALSSNPLFPLKNSPKGKKP